jgi:cysteinyl-tRNA synthetase
MVVQLEKLGYTYKIEGDGIYYDVSKFPDYEKLGHQSLDEIKAGARIGEVEGKRHPADFALWKFSPIGEKRQMEWDSPWGKGFPGWAIECSAMALSRLGPKLDIHTGGVDHIKVHHTNEIAQSEPVIGHKWVNYWVHGEFLNDTTGKMSKSSGEFLTLSALKERGYRPIEYRYFLLLASYRTMIEFSFEALDAAAAGYKNLVRRVAALGVESGDAGEWGKRMLESVQNDLNTAEAITVLQELLKDSAADNRTKLAAVKFIDSLLGLTLIEDAKALDVKIDADLQKLIDARAAAKAAKDFAKSDAIRAEIEAMGYIIEDAKDGIKITRKI